LKKPPADDEIEVSVFGRGYGECLLISCSNREFVVVDSFLGETSNNPIALDYLDAIGVGASAIKRIVLTHWHQDHITGISTILKNASQDSQLIMSPIIKQEKLNSFLQIGIKENNPSTKEFNEVLKFVHSNKDRILIPVPNRLISSYNENGIEIFALTPSDADLMEYINAIIIPDENRKTSYAFPKDNQLSIVMLVKFGEDGVLLGSDLENKKNKNSSWLGLINNYEHKKNKPSLIKIPHHGSSNAHHERLWSEILMDKPLSVLTVFNRGDVELPKNEDVERIKNLSNELYIVGDSLKRNRELEKEAKKSMSRVNIQIVPNRVGLVRFRRNYTDNRWKVESFGAVKKYN